MFSNLFFILLILALINFVPEAQSAEWITSSKIAFEVGWLLYAFWLLIIYLQIRMLHRSSRLFPSSLTFLANLELLFFLCLYHFGLGAHRLLLEGPYLQELTMPYALVSLLLYLFGLGWNHYWLVRLHLVRSHTTPFKYAYLQLQFLLPFFLPFIFFGLILDGLSLLPFWKAFATSWNNSAWQVIVTIGISLALLLLALILMPPLVILCWQCRPIRDAELINKLETVCQQTHFRHAGFKIWSVMNYAFTAGIIGVVPRFRYIMFTQRLIDNFSIGELQAILIHEMGHSRHRHLLIYPFILAGMLLIATLLTFVYADILAHFFTYQDDQTFSKMGKFFFPLSLFGLYALFLGLYFRFIFGFFSRLFERQADLNIFEYPLSPTYMIQALDHLGVVTGYTHQNPSWHHYSLQERINFLQAAIKEPQLIGQHHRKVKKWVILYFIFLGFGCLTLFFVLL